MNANEGAEIVISDARQSLNQLWSFEPVVDETQQMPGYPSSALLPYPGLSGQQYPGAVIDR